MQISKFDAGLSTRIDPTLIKLDEAVEFTNVDNSAVVLKNAKDFLSTADLANDYFYRFSDTWVSSDNERNYLEYKDKLYWTDIVDGPQKFDGTNTNRIGIVRPPALPAEDELGDPILDFEGEQVIGIVLTEEDVEDSDFGSPQLIEGSAGSEFVSADNPYIYRISLTEGGVESTFITEQINLTQDVNTITIRFNATATTPNIKVYRQYNGDWRLVGSITLSDLNAKTITDSTLDISGNELFTQTISADSQFQYTMTYYNSTDDIESAPMDFTKLTPLNTDKRVVLSQLPVSTDPQVDKKRIYRIGGNLTEFSLVAEIDNIDEEYTDLVADIVEGKILDTVDNFELPDTARFLTEAYDILFAAVGSELRFSKIGEPDAWPQEYSLSLPRDITGILPCSAGILVFTIGKTRLVVGSSPGEFALIDISNDQGCISHLSCQTIKGIPYWLSRDGLCVYSAGIVEVRSKSRLGKQTFDIKQTALYDEHYYILKNDGSLLVFDFRFGEAIKEFTFSAALGGIGAFDNILYGVSGDNIVKLFEGDDLSLTYVSPVYTSGDYSNLKSFDQSYVHMDGDFTFETFIDGKSVSSINHTGSGIKEITMPATEQQGGGIQYKITGTGVIWSIEHKGVTRKNGR